MSDQLLPDTDNVKVALIAATFLLLDQTRAWTGALLEERLNAFINTYEVLSTLVEFGAHQARKEAGTEKS